MVPIQTYFAVMPPVYELELGFWRWCKLKEICAIIPDIARIAEIDFAPTPEELVSRFAALVRFNRGPNFSLFENISQEERIKMKKKIFRYSKDGTNLWGTEVPITQPQPPYVPFQLDIETPYPKELFVPEGWVIDTLKAIRLGAVAAADFEERKVKVGFPPAKSDRNLITLEGSMGGVALVKLPECVR